MDTQLVQRTRYMLRARARQAQKAPQELFPSSCAQLMAWVNEHPMLGPLLEHCRATHLELAALVDRFAKEVLAGARSVDQGHFHARTANEHGVLCALCVDAIAKTAGGDPNHSRFMVHVVADFVVGREHHKLDETYESCKDIVVDGLYEFLDAQIDATQMTFGLLLKYKQHVEWFRRDSLRQLQPLDERRLARDLQEYVFASGFDYVVEATSASGEADIVLRDADGRRLIVDAKLIRSGAEPSGIRRALASGFHQVARYCADYNEPHGFLVVFSLTESVLRMDLDDAIAGGLRALRIGGTTVYCLIVSIADLPSASRAGKAEELTISREALLSELQEA